MTETIKLTEMGENIESGIVTAILAKVGDNVSAGHPLIEIETDKAVLPFPAPSSGTIMHIFIAENDEIRVGDKILSLNSTASVNPNPNSNPTATASPTPPPTNEAPAPHPVPTPNPIDAPEIPPPTPSPAPKAAILPPQKVPSSDTPASPGTRKLARELGINLALIPGSGRLKRITMDDLKIYVKKTLTHSGPSTPPPPQQLPDFSQFGTVSIEKVSRLRQTIAKNMSLSWSSIPHVHHFTTANISTITQWQKKYKNIFKEKGSTLSVTPILIKAIATCLQEFPTFNSSFDAARGELILKSYINIGVAVATPAGLIVPVLKNIDQKSIFTIGQELRLLAQKTRDRQVSLNELKGASITLSNLGGIGGEQFTPIINHPEVAILAAAKTTSRLELIDNLPAYVPFIPLTLGYDHRVIDGALAARFIVRLKALIENPEALLMGLTLS